MCLNSNVHYNNRMPSVKRPRPFSSRARPTANKYRRTMPAKKSFAWGSGVKPRGPEVKEYITKNILVGQAETGVFLLNDVVSGSGIQDRIGRHVTAMGSDLCLSWVGAGHSQPVDYFYALVWDKMGNASTPSFSDVFVGAGAAGSTACYLRNTANYRDRFIVLYEVRSTLSGAVPTTLNTSYGPTFDGNKFKRSYRSLRGMDVEYQPDQSAPVAGGLYLMFAVNRAASGDVNNLAKATYIHKFTYTDS